MFDISLRVESIRDVCQKNPPRKCGNFEEKKNRRGRDAFQNFFVQNFLFKISCSKFLFLFERKKINGIGGYPPPIADGI